MLAVERPVSWQAGMLDRRVNLGGVTVAYMMAQADLFGASCANLARRFKLGQGSQETIDLFCHASQRRRS